VVIFHDEAPRLSYYFSVDGQQCILGHELSDLDLIRADVRATRRLPEPEPEYPVHGAGSDRQGEDRHLHVRLRRSYLHQHDDDRGGAGYDLRRVDRQIPRGDGDVCLHGLRVHVSVGWFGWRLSTKSAAIGLLTAGRCDLNQSQTDPWHFALLLLVNTWWELRTEGDPV